MGALTGGPEWEIRYRHFESLLDAAIKQTIAVAPNGAVRQAAEQTDLANQRLAEMEQASFDFARQGRLDEAKRLLDSSEYSQEEEAYAETVAVCKRAIESRVDEELQYQIRRSLIGLALTLAALLTLSFGWAGVLRVVHQGIDERLVLLSRLESAIRARDEFLSIASHELKTPLTTLKLQAESLTRKMRREGTEVGAREVPRKLDIITRQVNRLSSLINELLDTTRITSGHMVLTLEDNVDLSALIRENLSRFEDEFARASCTVEVRGIERPILGRWDRLRLDQVLSNLIANALKYGGGNPIELEAAATERTAALTVRDHGIGIPLEKQSIIFSRFERAVPDRQYGGFGLGLWIVREIAVAMGGEVSVTSRPGKGATFFFVLPRCSPPSPP